jgi:hypothetical protein
MTGVRRVTLALALVVPALGGGCASDDDREAVRDELCRAKAEWADEAASLYGGAANRTVASTPDERRRLERAVRTWDRAAERADLDVLDQAAAAWHGVRDALAEIPVQASLPETARAVRKEAGVLLGAVGAYYREADCPAEPGS